MRPLGWSRKQVSQKKYDSTSKRGLVVGLQALDELNGVTGGDMRVFAGDFLTAPPEKDERKVRE